MRRNIGGRLVWRKFRKNSHEILIGKMPRGDGTTSWTVLYDTIKGDTIQGNGDTLKEALKKLRLRVLLDQNPDLKTAHERLKKRANSAMKFRTL